jgi:uncharacterized protein (DUF433 family)
MSLEIETQPLPLMMDDDGVVRVGGTRVTIDTVIYAFLEGATAEEIAQQYPSLSLADIYSVISYYLNQSDQVNLYLQKRESFSLSVKLQNESRYDPNGIRDRLLARLLSKEK